MEDGGATYLKLGSLFMHHFSTGCTWIINIVNENGTLRYISRKIA